MSKRFLVLFFVFLLSVTLVGSVYAGPRVSGRFSVGSLIVDGTATNLREHSEHGVTVKLDALLDGLCGHDSDHFSDAAVSASTFIPAEEIHRGQRAEFEIEIPDAAIDVAVEEKCGTLGDWTVEALTATLTLREGGYGDVLDATSYECRVNYNRPTKDDTRSANCHIVN